MEIASLVPLAPYTTLGVGGLARYFCTVKTAADLREVCAFARRQTGQPPFILGGGSNVYFTDDILERVVVRLALTGVSVREEAAAVFYTAAAGEDWDAIVADSVARGLSGLENLSGIPGTVGAAPVQNINAYGASVADVIECVSVYDSTTDTVRELSAAACQFGYRDSVFKQAAGAAYSIISVTFRLAPAAAGNVAYASSSQSIARIIAEAGDVVTPTTVRTAVLTARSNIGMLKGQHRSAGSFFKNTILDATTFTQVQTVVQEQFSALAEKYTPWYWELPDGRVKVSTAFLLECSPYNKTTYGTVRSNGVGFSPQHSLSIVTEPGATAAAVRAFVLLVRTAVAEIFSVQIEPEVLYIDNEKNF